MNIGILGGGFTGLTAAYAMLKAGHSVTIIEKADAVGGLARGIPIAGTSLERTYHHIFRTDTDILRLSRELGIEDSLLWCESSIGVYYGGALYPFRTPLDLLRFRPLSVLNRLRLGLVLFYLQKTRSWKKFTRISAERWLKQMCGDEAYRIIWHPLLYGKFHHFASRISMAWLWARIHTRANSKEKGGLTEKLGYFRGGFATVIYALEKEIHRMRGAIRCEETVTALFSDEQKRIRVVTEKERYVFDKVIATIPSPVFANLIKECPEASDSYLEKLRSVEYLGAVCMIVRMNVSLSPFYWMNIHDPASPFLVFIEHTNLIPQEQYEGSSLYYLGAYLPHDHRLFTSTDDDIRKEFFRYLKKMFPHFREEYILETHISRLKYAQHIVDTSYEERIPPTRTPIPNMYLSNFSQIFPEDRGTNFAVREGYRIAEILNVEAK